MRSAPAAKYAFPVTFMCRQLEVSTSGYYEWRSRPESATALRRKALTAQITDIFDVSDATYGYRRVRAQLERNGVEASLELVRFLMREAGLVPCQPKAKRRNLTDWSALLFPETFGTSICIRVSPWRWAESRAPSPCILGRPLYAPVMSDTTDALYAPVPDPAPHCSTNEAAYPSRPGPASAVPLRKTDVVTVIQ